MTTFRRPHNAQSWGRWLGPIVGFVLYCALPTSYLDSAGNSVAFSVAGRTTAATAAWMAIWWMTEAIPHAVTALLPLAVFPLTGAANFQEAASPYANETIFLFLGGFLLALAMERWELHRDFAFASLRCVGTNPRSVIAAFMGVTAFISMWISNTATALMMLPIAMSVIALADSVSPTPNSDERFSIEKKYFASSLLLGVAYAASIGGVGTLIGTPPNLFLASYAKSNLHSEISFVRWMSIGVPLVVVFIPIAWLLLTRIAFPIRNQNLLGDLEDVLNNLSKTRKFSAGAKATLCVFLVTASAWIFRSLLTPIQIAGYKPFARLSDAGIAMVAAISLFLLPADRAQKQFVMDWKTALRVPWEVLILFGGGLSLAAAIQKNSVDQFLASYVSALVGLPLFCVILLVVSLTVFLSEVTSNTAMAAAIIPILAGLAPTLHIHPFGLIVPATLAASWAFMLPVGTPPNAIVFGTQRISITEMCRTGFLLNLTSIIVITLFSYCFLEILLNFSFGA